MPDKVGTLLKGSWSYFTAHFKAVLIGSIVFGALIFGAESFLNVSATDKLEDQFGDLDKIEELSERIEAGDEEAFQEMMMQLGVMGDEGQMDEEAMGEMASGMMMGLLPAFGTFFVVMSLLTLVGSIYFLVLAVDGKSAGETFKRIPGLILPMLGVWIWSFLRSFAWIPVIGIIPAIIIGPRLMFASVILVKEGKGVMGSVSESYSRTRGYWGKIVGNMILMIICVWICTLALLLGLGALAMVHVLLSSIAASLVTQFVTAYGSVFTVKLADTIFAHPLKVATKKA